jgi:thioredoxin-related protein
MVSSATAKDLITKLKIRSYPTTLVISPDYALTDRITGYLPPAEMERRLTRAAQYVATRSQRGVR